MTDWVILNSSLVLAFGGATRFDSSETTTKKSSFRIKSENGWRKFLGRPSKNFAWLYGEICQSNLRSYIDS